MRIAFVSQDPGVPIYGRKGCSIHVQEVVRALTRSGVEVEIHSPRLDGTPPPGLADVRTFALPRNSKGDAGTRETALIASNDQLASNLRSCDAYDAVYERHSIWSTAGMDFAQAAGIPGILEVNSPLIEEQAAHRSLVHRDLAERMVEQSIGTASHLVAVSKGVAEYIERFDVDSDRVHVLPNGVDTDRFSPCESRGSKHGEFTVGFVGTLKPWHDLSTLVQAFASLRGRGEENSGCRLLIVGDGPERDRLTSLLDDLGLLGAVHFTGSVDPADVPRWIDEMDVGVAPYPADGDCYFSPLKIFEYMAAGLPVAASRIGQIPELIEDGETGLLWTPGDHEALASILEGLRSDPRQRAQLGRRARQKAVEAHTWDSVVAKTLQLSGLSGLSGLSSLSGVNSVRSEAN
jgi:glycosyltransferase involved in cell wall biosynthesis